MSIKKIESIVDKIGNQLEKLGKTEVPSSKIGRMVMAELYELDEVAYVRFASVYRKFKDVSDFISEVKEFESKTEVPVPGKNRPRSRTTAVRVT